MSRRPLVLVGVVAFVVVDVVLVTLAVRSSSGTDPAPPPQAAGRTQSPSPTPTQTAASEIRRGAPLLLAGGADRTVLRARPGSCDGPPARVAVSRDGGETFGPRDTVAQAVLRLSVTSLADMWMAGRNANCEPTFYRSGDGGQSWTATDGTQGVWHLLPGGEAVLHAPDGRVDLPCAPVALSSAGVDFAAVGCDNGDLVTTGDGGDSWRSRGSVHDVVDLAFLGPRRGFALSLAADCAAAVSGTTDGGRSWQRLSCIDGAGPGRAMTFVGDDLLVHTGPAQVHRSDDGGATWQRL